MQALANVKAVVEADTLLVVSGLAQPELRVEIEAMAVKPLRATARRRVKPAKRAGRGRRR